MQQALKYSDKMKLIKLNNLITQEIIDNNMHNDKDTSMITKYTNNI